MKAKMEKLKLYLQDFWRYRYLVYYLISRDFKLKYRRSVLGVVWSVLNPLLMSLVMYLVVFLMTALSGVLPVAVPAAILVILSGMLGVLLGRAVPPAGTSGKGGSDK